MADKTDDLPFAKRPSRGLSCQAREQITWATNPFNRHETVPETKIPERLLDLLKKLEDRKS